MKKILALIAGILFLMIGVCQAQPFLVCDTPDPAEQVTSYIIYQDAVEIATPTAESDGSLRMDLQAITPGVYTWTAKAVNAWGQSIDSDPYISPSGANAPVGVNLEP